MDSAGNIFILEINSMASLGLTGSYVFAAETAGYTYDSLANRMLDVAAVRYFGTEYSKLTSGSKNDADTSKPLRVRLRSHIRSNLTTMVDNLEKMVGINSGLYNTENVNSLGKWMASQLKQAGFQCETHTQEEVGNILSFTNHEEETNDILLLGHLDTYYSYQDFVPFREERGRFYGSGVAESKGGLVVMLAALKALRFARQLKKVRCGILLITDDSLGDTYSRKIVQRAAENSRAVIGLKCGGKSGGIVTSCGGRLDFTIEISNIKDTASSHPANVIAALAKKLLALDKLSSADSGIRVNVRKVEGRTLYGDTPDYASLVIDVFYQSVEQAGDLEKEIRKIAGRDIKAPMYSRLQKGINRPPKIESKATLALYERLNSLGEALEIKTASIHRSTSSAISYVPRDVPALEGLGPAGGDFRSPREYILRDSLIDRATLLALLIHESSGRSG
jgi:D-alanine-D-alanine ligase